MHKHAAPPQRFVASPTRQSFVCHAYSVVSGPSFPSFLPSFPSFDSFFMPPRSSRSPKKPRKKAGASSNGKKSGRPRRKASEAQDHSGQSAEEADTPPKTSARVVWDRFPERTERLLDYLNSHPDVAIKLFGDSTKSAKSEGRLKLTAKSNKATAYLQLADGIFSIDDDSTVRADFAANPTKYTKAVDNYITS